MAFFSSRKVNEGINLEGKGNSIDIIVKEVEGSMKKRNALFEIRKNQSSEEFYMNYDDPEVKINEDIRFDIFTTSNKPDEVRIALNASKEYAINIKSYPIA
jgi:sRNA-binding carbon storage regulator CsrA